MHSPTVRFWDVAWVCITSPAYRTSAALVLVTACTVQLSMAPATLLLQHCLTTQLGCKHAGSDLDMLALTPGAPAASEQSYRQDARLGRLTGF